MLVAEDKKEQIIKDLRFMSILDVHAKYNISFDELRKIKNESMQKAAQKALKLQDTARKDNMLVKMESSGVSDLRVAETLSDFLDACILKKMNLADPGPPELTYCGEKLDAERCVTIKGTVYRMEFDNKLRFDAIRLIADIKGYKKMTHKIEIGDSILSRLRDSHGEDLEGTDSPPSTSTPANESTLPPKTMTNSEELQPYALE